MIRPEFMIKKMLSTSSPTKTFIRESDKAEIREYTLDFPISDHIFHIRAKRYIDPATKAERFDIISFVAEPPMPNPQTL